MILAKNHPTNQFFHSTYLIPLWERRIYHPQPSGAPSEPKNGRTYHPRYTIFPSSYFFVANIMYSTPKIIPLTNFFIQPISYLSGIGVSTIPDHRGPLRAPKRPQMPPTMHHFP